jgi:hypothetical protein
MTSNEEDSVLKMVLFVCTLCESGDSVFAKVRRNKISHLSAVSLFRVSILRDRTCNMHFTHLLSLPEGACEDSSCSRRAVWVQVLLRLPARQPRVF